MSYTGPTGESDNDSFKKYVKVNESKLPSGNDGTAGKLCYLDAVEISKASFKLGSSAISVTSSVDGDTATYTGTIPTTSRTITKQGSSAGTCYKREYNSETKEYDYYSVGTCYYGGSSETINNIVASTDFTATITVEAVTE